MTEQGEVISQADLDALLSHTDSFFSHVFHFTCTDTSKLGKSTCGAAITYSDLIERRPDFVKELKNSICSWVYSISKYSGILQSELKLRGYNHQNAVSHINALAQNKFRKGHPQGQFGELLLFNFIQHFFKAPPLLHKMPITTNPAIERHGADAIHLASGDDGLLLYIGEAKTYISKYQFNTAFNDALSSIVNAYKNHQDEFDLYVYDEFIDEPLVDVAKKIKRGQLKYKSELVSVISYEENKSVSAASEDEIKERIKEAILYRLANIDQSKFHNIDSGTVQKMHFFVIPFWSLDALLKDFES